MSDADKTDPGLLKKAANWTKEANEAADPRADKLLDAIKSSPWTIAIAGATHVACFLLGLWAAWPRK